MSDNYMIVLEPDFYRFLNKYFRFYVDYLIARPRINENMLKLLWFAQPSNLKFKTKTVSGCLDYDVNYE